MNRKNQKLAVAVIAAVALLGIVNAKAAILFSNPGPILIDDNNAYNLSIPGGIGTGSTQSNTLYFKYTVTNPASNYLTENISGGNYYAGMSLYDGANEHVGIGNGWGPSAYSAFSGPGDFDLNSTTDDNPGPGVYQYVRSTDITTIVFRIDFTSGGNDSVTVWLNPNLALSEANQNPALKTTFIGNADFNTVYLREGDNNINEALNANGWTYSNIAIAGLSSDVFGQVPEPTTGALLGMGGLLVFWTRRCQSARA